MHCEGPSILSGRPYCKKQPKRTLVHKPLSLSEHATGKGQLAKESTTNSETGLANTVSANDDKICSYSTFQKVHGTGGRRRVSRLRYMSRTDTHGDYNQANKFVLVFVPFLGSKALLFLLQHLTLSIIKKYLKE